MKRMQLMIVAAAVVASAGLAHAEIAYGVTAQGRLVSFDTGAPSSLLSGFAISGLANNEQISGIDFRPNDGFLYGLGSQNNWYRINTSNGQATLVAALTMPLNGASFGTDFNPTGPVAFRIVSNTGKNYRMTNPGTGATIVQDTDLNYVAGDSRFGTKPNVTHVAYTNSFAGATSTVLYGIDAGTDTLVRFGSPNAGTLNTVGTLGMGTNLNINVLGGFDISGATGMAYAVTQNTSLSRSTLWGINLMTGAGMDLGEVAGGETLVAFSIVPSPASLGVLGAGLLAAGRRRRV
ncbi:MAG: DUF4394 domain-containing protein [Planctomycetota bacterium]|nr:DUF4394 domain-containing protein [Planctomycetota bacterium]